MSIGKIGKIGKEVILVERKNEEIKTLSVPKAGRVLGIGRNASYEAARRGDIPTIRIGRLLLCR